MEQHSSALAPPPLPREASVRWGRLYGSTPALALTQVALRAEGPVVVVAASARDAERLAGELQFFSDPVSHERDRLAVLAFPDWETLPYDAFSPHPDIVSARLAALRGLPTLERGLVVITAASLMQRLPPRSYVEQGSLSLSVGQRLELHEARRQLDAAGYACVPEVTEHGEYAVRGSLVDIFPMGSEEPYRIDLFDDEIETLRRFDPETQLSTGRLDRIELLPAREFPMTDAAIRLFRRQYRRRFEGDPNRSSIYREVSEGITPGGIEYYLPLFFEATGSFFDYLPERSTLAQLERVRGVAERTWSEIEARYEQRAHDVERPVLEPRECFLTPAEVAAAAEHHASVFIEPFELPDASGEDEARHNFATASPPRLALDAHLEQPASALLGFLDALDGRVLFAAESPGRREQLRDTLRDAGLEVAPVAGWGEFLRLDRPVGITVAPLERGLVLEDAGLAVVVEEQLLGERARQRVRRRPRRDPEAIVRDLTDLRAGAPVVHEEYGVGRYVGLEALQVGGVTAEFLTLEYAGGDRLYVPVHALQLITRYTGASPEHAPLHRLGSDQWTKARSRAARKIHDVAAELLDIYSRRQARQGQSFTVDAHEYRLFETVFPFEETPDQHRAIGEVLEDMRTARPMDRIVCGDVGFGKTEVAMRAAFVAVEAGQQCAVLVPTTLLAQQHYQTFRDRFADWPIRIEVLSRFRSPKHSAEILKGLANGRVDIVIGTHKLLQDRVRFRNLGLVIIDEEHRFGVRHKERLKALRADVDVLTLTATPIPRTLNMAMGGLRELSLITTPPQDRLAIKTFVSEWNPVLVREACLREIKRGGQVFYVHNEVESIEASAEALADLVPEASIRVAHGQLRERELERIMVDFYHRRFSVLVCTTIIESGIDIPTANTIIIDRADRFGLAQLHQLRGRVGRSHHRAYAYLIVPPREAMTADAMKRLEAIESLEELGAGFVLATHDLEIRGAGELLGDEQHGQIHEIGFALYTELLERAVNALKDGRIPDMDAPLHRGPQLDLRVPALLPADYMPDVHLRLVMYKRIASADSAEELRDLQVEMIDRFGLLPEAAKTLFEITELRLKAAPLGIHKIEVGPAGGRILFAEPAQVDPEIVVGLVQQDPRTFKLDGQQTLRFTMPLEAPRDRFRAVRELLDRLGEPGTCRESA